MLLDNLKKQDLLTAKNMEDRFKLRNGPINKVTKEKKYLKNKGIIIKPNGIKIRNASSNVSELVIQWMPLK